MNESRLFLFESPAMPITDSSTPQPVATMKLEKVILSGNCYWCTEAMYQEIKGCYSIVPGFFHFKTQSELSDLSSCNLSAINVTELTGKVEALGVVFDSNVISLEAMLEVFFITHNPTLVSWVKKDCFFPLNRSAIIINQGELMNDSEQRRVAQEAINKIKTVFDVDVHTKILNEAVGSFKEIPQKEWSFYAKNPKDGYSTSIVEPKIEKLKSIYPNLLK